LGRVCGIVGYIGRERLSAGALLACMQRLQVDREKWERTPVGGHGAGIAAWTPTGEVAVLKVGGTGDPVGALTEEIKRAAPWLPDRGSGILLGHVRRASPRFQASVPYRAAAQPYVASCRHGLQVIGIHNGFASNYRTLLRQRHVLESVDLGPIDSETLPHLVEELLIGGSDLPVVAEEVGRRITGGNSAFFLIRRRGAAWAIAVHRGKTRGLAVWENSAGEVVFVSRPGCLGPELSGLLDRGGFRDVFRVGRRETARFARAWHVRP
jgi:glucosamine 6-phosphate synthetase-like amidotransferase/phosphosugar isomerase protein